MVNCSRIVGVLNAAMLSVSLGTASVNAQTSSTGEGASSEQFQRAQIITDLVPPDPQNTNAATVPELVVASQRVPLSVLYHIHDWGEALRFSPNSNLLTTSGVHHAINLADYSTNTYVQYAEAIRKKLQEIDDRYTTRPHTITGKTREATLLDKVAAQQTAVREISFNTVCVIDPETGRIIGGDRLEPFLQHQDTLRNVLAIFGFTNEDEIAGVLPALSALNSNQLFNNQLDLPLSRLKAPVVFPNVCLMQTQQSAPKVPFPFWTHIAAQQWKNGAWGVCSIFDHTINLRPNTPIKEHSQQILELFAMAYVSSLNTPIYNNLYRQGIADMEHNMLPGNPKSVAQIPFQPRQVCAHIASGLASVWRGETRGMSKPFQTALIDAEKTQEAADHQASRIILPVNPVDHE